MLSCPQEASPQFAFASWPVAEAVMEKALQRQMDEATCLKNTTPIRDSLLWDKAGILKL